MFNFNDLYKLSGPLKARYNLRCIYTINLFVSGNWLPLAYHMLNITAAFEH